MVIKNYRRDGTSFWSRVQIGPMRDGNGKITLIVGVQCEVNYLILFNSTRDLALFPPLLNNINSFLYSFHHTLLTQVDAPSDGNTTNSSGSTDERGSSNSSDDGNGGDSSCSWNGSTISAGSGCNNDTRSEGSNDDASEGGTNDDQ